MLAPANLSRLEAITFDLDDTLWDNAGVMQRTEHGHVDWLNTQLAAWQARRGEPATGPIDLERYLAARQAMARQHWSRRGDFSWLREHSLVQLLVENGLDQDSAREWAARAMQQFHQLRIDVTPFPGADAMLERLASRYRLGSITNGNVAFERLAIARHFHERIAAGEMLAPKPDPRPFLAMLARLNVRPERALHVGDSWEEDILPARRLGMQAAWIAPTQTQVTDLPAGVFHLTCVTELEALLS
ncbi:HAD family hydrolase [Halomonas denitrificans]|uniref:HAD family hydrolase n=1 Tax=Halomonas TaxID=2745 RepID=UPI001CD4989D|nr:HAD family hydrolase [Halomonas denitrificans]MCA0974017.1 HAD family hydrolase [Halomonas denitrificans]MED5296583.1 HAD family hydrolase [Pseudomonadota bacterium]